MGIYIKGVEKPAYCGCCFANCILRQYNWSSNRTPDNCPLVPVPPHGRLGDLDVLFEFVESKYKVAKGEARKAYSDVLDFICAAGDIIEAEEGE